MIPWRQEGVRAARERRRPEADVVLWVVDAARRKKFGKKLGTGGAPGWRGEQQERSSKWSNPRRAGRAWMP